MRMIFRTVNSPVLRGEHGNEVELGRDRSFEGLAAVVGQSLEVVDAIETHRARKGEKLRLRDHFCHGEKEYGDECNDEDESRDEHDDEPGSETHDFLFVEECKMAPARIQEPEHLLCASVPGSFGTTERRPVSRPLVAGALFGFHCGMHGIGIGLVGYGSIGRIHTLSYRDLPLLYPGALPGLNLAAVCTSRPETARAAAEEGGYASWFTDVNELVRQDKVSVVDCCTPNYQHRQTILAAIAARKHVYCEKPLALNVAEAREIAREAGKAGVFVGLTFNYRFVPALLRAKQLIADGSLGEVYSFRAEYYHTGYQDPRKPLSWRMKEELSGGGALVDMGSHVIDLVLHLLGGMESVRAVTKTYIKQRPVGAGIENPRRCDRG